MVALTMALPGTARYGGLTFDKPQNTFAFYKLLWTDSGLADGSLKPGWL